MQSSLKTPRMIAVLIRVGFCLLLVTTSLAQDRDLVELMQSDLFGLPNWRSKIVATIKGGNTIYCYIIRVQ